MSVIGQQRDVAIQTLTTAGYSVPDGYIREVNDSSANGTVIDQSPKTTAIPGAAIALTISKGPAS